MTSETKDYRSHPEDELVIDEHPESAEQSGRSIIIKTIIALAIGLGIYLLPTPSNLPAKGTDSWPCS